MKKIHQRFAVLVFVLASLLGGASTLSGGVWGCGGTAGDSGGGNSDDNPEATEVQTEADLTCEGVTSAELEAGGATAAIPEGQLDSCANASPTLSLTTTTATLDDNDVDISSGGNSVQLNLNADFDTTTVPGDNDGEDTDITIVLPYDDSAVGAGDEDSLHIYVMAEDQDTGAAAPLAGDLDTTANTITISTKGLPMNTIFTVVYNADMDAIASDDPDISALRLPRGISALTQSTWPTNVWCVVWNAGDATLRSVVAGILGKNAADLTNDDIKEVLGERVAANAETSGEEYQELGFRAPHLYSQSADAATRACSGTTSPVYFVHMRYSGGSAFQPDEPAENLDTDTLAGFGTKFGRLYVAANRLDDAATEELGTVESSVAHEMFHGIQAGYELYRSGERVRGVTEGSAATIGKTLDGDGTNGSEPQVRDFADETYSLDNYLLNGEEDYRYSNQDFFAYVARKYNSDSFDFLPTYFAAYKNRLDALTTAADVTAPPWATFYGALEDGITNGISSSLDLATAYFAFATDRLVEHSATSRFGRTGETTTAGTLATEILSVNSGLQASLSGDPDSLNVRKTSNQMGSYSTRVFKVTPTSASDDENGRRLKVTVTPSEGTFGTDFRVKYYRGGSASGTTASAAEFEVSNWGKTTDDEIIVVVSNTQVPYGVTFTYSAVTEEETESAGEELACAIGDAACYFCSGPASGPVDASIPGVDPDYPQAYLVIGWDDETTLNNFDFDLSDSTDAFIEATATNIDIDPGDRVLGGNTNIDNISATRNSVTITLESLSVGSAFPAGEFGIESGDTELIRTVTVTATFSGDTAEIDLTAEGWDGGEATAKFTGVYQTSDYCSF